MVISSSQTLAIWLPPGKNPVHAHDCRDISQKKTKWSKDRGNNMFNVCLKKILQGQLGDLSVAVY